MTFAELKNQSSALIKRSATLAEELGYPISAAKIKEIIEKYEKKEFMLVAAGEARRGKSSLLNALINEVIPIFPVDINVCTNVVTYLRYGKKEKIEAISQKENGNCKIEEITREQIQDYVSEKGNPNNYKNVTALNVYLPNEFLRNGIVVVDTPGVGSLNIVHAQTSYSVLPDADLLLFVSDTYAGFTESELSFLKRGYEYCQNILFPITKIDKNAEYDVIVEDNRKKIHDTIGMSDNDIKVIPVSSLSKIKYLEKGTSMYYENSNFEELEQCIQATIEQTRAEVMILPYVTEVLRELEKISYALETQYQALDNSKEDVEKMLAALNMEKERLKNLQESGAKWKTDINDRFMLLNNDVAKQQRETRMAANQILDRNLTKLGKNICKEDNRNKVLEEINHEFVTGVMAVKNLIMNSTNQLIGDVNESLGLTMDINKKLLQNMNVSTSSEIEVDFSGQTKVSRIKEKGGEIGRDAYVFTAVGGAVGTIIGGIGGLLLGGPAGAVIGVKAGMAVGSSGGGMIGTLKGVHTLCQKYNNTDVNKVKQVLQQYIMTVMDDMKTDVNNITTHLKQETVQSFQTSLENRIHEIEDNAVQIKSNIRLGKDELEKKRGELQNSKKKIKNLADSYHIVFLEVDKMKENEKSSEKSIEKDGEVTYDFL